MLRVKLVSLSMLAIIFCHSNRLYAQDVTPDPDPQLDPMIQSPRTGSFKVTASITKGCEFDKTAYALPLIVRNNGSASSDSVPISVYCTLKSDLQLSVDNGKNWSNGTRRLINENGQFISYTIHLDDSSSGGGTSELNHQFNDKIDYNFFLKATANISNALAGKYQDTVTFLLIF